MASDYPLDVVRLSDLGEFKNGANFGQEDYGPGFPIINVKQLYSGRYVNLNGLESLRASAVKKPEALFVRPGDILFARSSVKRSGAGQCAVVPPGVRDTVFSGFVIRYRIDDHRRANPDFLGYLLASPIYREVFQRIATGTTISNLSQAALGSMEIQLPRPETQRAIAEMLSVLDDRIDLLRQTNATLEAIAQALFKSWFVDFDPVRAKAEGREPEGMDAATAALFPSEFEGSELGLIPKGWRRGPLGDICRNIRQQAKPDSLDPTTPYIGLEHMPRGSIALTEAGISSGLASGKFWYAKNDVLFGKLRPYFHKVGVASHTGVCSTDILVVRASEPDWFGFTAMQLSSDEIIAYATRLSNGAKMPRSSWSDIAAYKVVIPPEPVARSFDGLVRAIIERIHANIDRATNLVCLRDTLLPRLISGKLRLPDAEESIEAGAA